MGPTEKEIRYDGHRGVRVGPEPLDDRVVECGGGAYFSREPGLRGGEGFGCGAENEGLDGSGRVAGEEWLEEREVRRVDQNSDG